MKNWLVPAGLLSCTALFLAFGEEPPVIPTAPKSEAGLTALEERVSYLIGIQIGRDFNEKGEPLVLEAFMTGIKDGMAGAPDRLSQEVIQQTLVQYQASMAKRKDEYLKKQANLANKNKAEGEAFLATNKSKEGVVTLPSGLQYKVLKEGTGPVPRATDKVLVNYKGTFLNGRIFDQSPQNGATLEVQGEIRGWTEALLKMKVGSKWQLFIPSDLAYGPQGRPGVEPNAVLLFDFELLNIESSIMDLGIPVPGRK